MYQFISAFMVITHEHIFLKYLWMGDFENVSHSTSEFKIMCNGSKTDKKSREKKENMLSITSDLNYKEQQSFPMNS
jgi:hypothetical protein